MSMMGCFREIPASVMGRLQDDPTLVDDVVLAKVKRSRMPAEFQEHVAGAIEQMKASIADMGPQLLPMMPEEQRKVIEGLSPEQQKDVFRRLAEQLAKMKGWDGMLSRGSGESRLSDAQLGPLLEVDKAWHGLHFLLTGTPEEAPGPLGLAVLGGAPIGEDNGYGPARYLLPEEVVAVSDALQDVTHDELRSRYDPPALDAAKVYPGGWDDPANLEWLLESFDEVRVFYREAAGRGSAALLFIT